MNPCSVTLDEFKRRDVYPPMFGVLMPEQLSVSQWGMFSIEQRVVEVVEVTDLGKLSSGYVTYISTSKGLLRTVYDGTDTEKRSENDIAAIANMFGYTAKDVELL